MRKLFTVFLLLLLPAAVFGASEEEEAVEDVLNILKAHFVVLPSSGVVQINVAERVYVQVDVWTGKIGRPMFFHADKNGRLKAVELILFSRAKQDASFVCKTFWDAVVKLGWSVVSKNTLNHSDGFTLFISDICSVGNEVAEGYVFSVVMLKK